MAPKAATREPTVSAMDIDRVNLTQALRDFEVANARVIDLSERYRHGDFELRHCYLHCGFLRRGYHTPGAAVSSICTTPSGNMRAGCRTPNPPRQ